MIESTYYLLSGKCIRMNKKVLILVIAIVAAVAVLGVSFWLTDGFGLLRLNSSPSASTGEATITVASKTAEAGKNVRVPVTFTGNPGAMGFLLEFHYDPETLEYINVEKGDFLTDCEASEKDGVIKVIDVEDNDVKKDGVLFQLNFKVKDSAKGSTKVELVPQENDVCNYKEESVSYQAVSGTITIQ